MTSMGTCAHVRPAGSPGRNPRRETRGKQNQDYFANSSYWTLVSRVEASSGFERAIFTIHVP